MNSHIQITPKICHGKPVIRGTRVLISTILGALSGGDTTEMVLQDYPSLSPEDVAAALGFAGRLSDYQVSDYEQRHEVPARRESSEGCYLTLGRRGFCSVSASCLPGCFAETRRAG